MAIGKVCFTESPTRQDAAPTLRKRGSTFAEVRHRRISFENPRMVRFENGKDVFRVLFCFVVFTQKRKNLWKNPSKTEKSML